MLIRNIQAIALANCLLVCSCQTSKKADDNIVSRNVKYLEAPNLSDVCKHSAKKQNSIEGVKEPVSDGTANVEIMYQHVKAVNSRIETSGRTYSLMKIICGDFSAAETAEIRDQCRSA
jgi:hypothetical protein